MTNFADFNFHFVREIVLFTYNSIVGEILFTWTSKNVLLPELDKIFGSCSQLYFWLFLLEFIYYCSMLVLVILGLPFSIINSTLLRCSISSFTSSWISDSSIFLTSYVSGILPNNVNKKDNGNNNETKLPMREIKYALQKS